MSNLLKLEIHECEPGVPDYQVREAWINPDYIKGLVQYDGIRYTGVQDYMVETDIGSCFSITKECFDRLKDFLGDKEWVDHVVC